MWFEKFSDSGMNLIHFVNVHCFSRHDVNTYHFSLLDSNPLAFV